MSARRKSVLVHAMGGMWLLTERRWAAWLAEHALGKDPSLDDFGKYLGETQSVMTQTPEQSHEALCGPYPTGQFYLLPKATQSAVRQASYDDEGRYTEEPEGRGNVLGLLREIAGREVCCSDHGSGAATDSDPCESTGGGAVVDSSEAFYGGDVKL